MEGDQAAVKWTTTATRLALLLAFGFWIAAALHGCAGTPAPSAGSPSPAVSAVLAAVASQRGEDPLIGVWSAMNSGYSWSLAIIKEDNRAKGYTLKGVMVEPWPYFAAGEEVLYLKPSSVSGVYEGTQKWKTAFRIDRWFPARVVLKDGKLFTQFNSVRGPTKIATTWVYLRSDRPPDRKVPSQAKMQGSGFVLRGANLVLTNYHVVAGAEEISVFVRRQEHQATLLRQDAKNDLALLSVMGLSLQPNEGLPVNVSLQIRPGEPVFVIGYPLGEQLGVDASIVDGLVNALVGPNDDSTLFRLSAAVNMGNSGGPILNQEGEVVGVAVSALRGQLVEGIAFGIKIGTAAPLLGDLALGSAPRSAGPVAPERIFEQVSPWVVRVVAQ